MRVSAARPSLLFLPFQSDGDVALYSALALPNSVDQNVIFERSMAPQISSLSTSIRFLQLIRIRNGLRTEQFLRTGLLFLARTLLDYVSHEAEASNLNLHRTVLTSLSSPVPLSQCSCPLLFHPFALLQIDAILNSSD